MSTSRSNKAPRIRTHDLEEDWFIKNRIRQRKRKQIAKKSKKKNR